MRYFSIDPAIKSIAIAVIDIKPEEKKLFKAIKVVATCTADLIEGKSADSLSDYERCELIHRHINAVFDKYLLKGKGKGNNVALIEKQLKNTDTLVCYITLINICLMRGVKAYPANPCDKNRLTVAGMKLSDFYEKTLNSYTANKEHSRAMFVAIKDKLKGSDNISYNIRHERDISDCFTQLIAFLQLTDTSG